MARTRQGAAVCARPACHCNKAALQKTPLERGPAAGSWHHPDWSTWPCQKMFADAMLLVISPAKTLDLDSPLPPASPTQPQLLDEAERLVTSLRRKSPAQVSSLMAISDRLGALNASRFKSWSRPFTPDNARPALLTFAGDVYEGLDARSLSPSQLDFAQQHLRILSGLYGVLRPLDLIQPYRLEMGTRLSTRRGRNLYEFWGDRVTCALASALAGTGSSVLVNLASDEYFRSVRPSRLAAQIIQPVFEEARPDGARPYAVISFHAKRARGAMARFAIDKELTQARGLQQFDRDGYRFVAEASTDTRWVFRRG